MILHIVTRCTRPQNLLKMKDSVLGVSHGITVKWHIVFDTRCVHNVDTSILESLSNRNVSISFKKSELNDYGHSFLNDVHSSIGIGQWMYVLDDDNLLHPDFYRCIAQAYSVNSVAEAFVFSQRVDKKDFTGLDIRYGVAENMKVQGVDMAQIVFQRNSCKFVPNTYVADGIFIEELYKQKPEKFSFLPMVLCYYNYLEEKSLNHSLPKVLLVSKENLEIKSAKVASWESDEMAVMWKTSDDQIVAAISEFDPHVIVTCGGEFADFKNLMSLPFTVSKRWVHFNTPEEVNGEAVYCSAVKNMLDVADKPKISVFTSAFKSREKLIRAYNSLVIQTEDNWEWVIVNDANDPETSQILKTLSAADCRVKVYDFSVKSKGIIGEAKYRAATLCNGAYLVELDHDDCFTADCFVQILDGFAKFPDAGFLYSDCVELDNNMNCLTYGDSFAFDYGYTREETVEGKLCKISVSPNINPKTIRHIVGVPNHLRCWKRDVYFAIGGHNRRISIADDYELLVRTFLYTKFVKVNKSIYYQFYHSSNTQDSTRADIQRRVRSISFHYNEAIKKRFESLGKKDWAYEHNPVLPLLTPSAKGEEEGYVNYIHNAI